jgi:hypothetical protein
LVNGIGTEQISMRDAREGSPAEVLAAFLKLGLTSFGGPIAHLGFIASSSSADAAG